MLEALLGLLYIAVIIGRLVGRIKLKASRGGYYLTH